MLSRETHFLEFPNAFDLLHPPFNSSEQSKSTKKFTWKLCGENRTWRDEICNWVIGCERKKKMEMLFFSCFSIFLVACSFEFILWLIGVSYHITYWCYQQYFFSSNPCMFNLFFFFETISRWRGKEKKIHMIRYMPSTIKYSFFSLFSSRRALAVSLCWAKCKNVIWNLNIAEDNQLSWLLHFLLVSRTIFHTFFSRCKLIWHFCIPSSFFLSIKLRVISEKLSVMSFAVWKAKLHWWSWNFYSELV